jgi:hypothetical protein
LSLSADHDSDINPDSSDNITIATPHGNGLNHHRHHSTNDDPDASDSGSSDNAGATTANTANGTIAMNSSAFNDDDQ